MTVRATTPADAQAIADIYAHAVLKGVGTFEEAPPSPAGMEARRLRVIAVGLPHLVCERGGRVAGFAYASPFRLRPAYRYCAEDSVYVAPDFKGSGVGRELLDAVIVSCEALGLRQLVALVGDSDNTASLALHAAAGFETQGVLSALGYKHGRWLDVVWMQRTLNTGAATPPDATGLVLNEN